MSEEAAAAPPTDAPPAEDAPAVDGDAPPPTDPEYVL